MLKIIFCSKNAAVLHGGVSVLGGLCLPKGVSAQEGVSCDLSHNAFDVTCMLSHHQLRVNTSAAAYIVLVGHVTMMHAGIHPPVNRIRDRCKNITFPQLCGW